MGREKAAITNGWRLCSYCNGVVATVAGRRENCESELNTWRSAAIFNRFRAWCSGQRKPNYWGKCLHNGRGRGREGWNSKAEGVTKANGQN